MKTYLTWNTANDALKKWYDEQRLKIDKINREDIAVQALSTLNKKEALMAETIDIIFGSDL
jgi:hypothetical protein